MRLIGDQLYRIRGPKIHKISSEYDSLEEQIELVLSDKYFNKIPSLLLVFPFFFVRRTTNTVSSRPNSASNYPNFYYYLLQWFSH